VGSKERKEKEREIRRSEIIDAAEKVFFSKGYDASTMDDVAREAEFSKRTVYLYFNSKEQIYFEIMTRGYRRLITCLEEDMQELRAMGAPGAIEEIQQMGRTFYRFSRSSPDSFDAIMEYENGELDFHKGVPDSSREECYALGEQVMGQLIGALQRGAADGSLPAGLDAKQTALVLWASMVGVFNTARRKEKYLAHYYGTAPETFVQAALALFVRSIQTSDGGKSRCTEKE